MRFFAPKRTFQLVIILNISQIHLNEAYRSAADQGDGAGRTLSSLSLSPSLSLGEGMPLYKALLLGMMSIGRVAAFNFLDPSFISLLGRINILYAGGALQTISSCRLQMNTRYGSE